MTIQDQIDAYIAGQDDRKRGEMLELQQLVLKVLPACKLWFLDGKDSAGKTVSNPNIGYGSLVIRYADGTSREFYQIGLSANTTGISVYIMGIDDRTYLARTFGEKMGKASVSGYCIKFKTTKAIDVDVLEAAMRDGVRIQKEQRELVG